MVQLLEDIHISACRVGLADGPVLGDFRKRQTRRPEHRAPAPEVVGQPVAVLKGPFPVAVVQRCQPHIGQHIVQHPAAVIDRLLERRHIDEQILGKVVVHKQHLRRGNCVQSQVAQRGENLSVHGRAAVPAVHPVGILQPDFVKGCEVGKIARRLALVVVIGGGNVKRRLLCVKVVSALLVESAPALVGGRVVQIDMVELLHLMVAGDQLPCAGIRGGVLRNVLPASARHHQNVDIGFLVIRNGQQLPIGNRLRVPARCDLLQGFGCPRGGCLPLSAGKQTRSCKQQTHQQGKPLSIGFFHVFLLWYLVAVRLPRWKPKAAAVRSPLCFPSRAARFRVSTGQAVLPFRNPVFWAGRRGYYRPPGA